VQNNMAQHMHSPAKAINIEYQIKKLIVICVLQEAPGAWPPTLDSR
jgi:hypothetical protein